MLLHANAGTASSGAYASEIEQLIAALASQIATDAASEASDPAVARIRAVRLLSESVGMMVLSEAVAEVNPSLADEILAATGR